ncbi:MAG: peptidoglycan-binding protein [Archangium sp.]|nr:peptidoglycan-binding protein [Archangium sp.]
MSTIRNDRPTYQAFKGSLSETNGLAFGHKGAKVNEMQKMLKAAGFDPGPIDGKFGPRTEKALKAYQAATGGKIDGTLELSEFKRLQGNYEKITSTGFDDKGPAVNQTGGVDLPVQTSGAQGPGTAAEMLRLALKQNGDRYVFGAEVRLDDKDPHTFDCSELVQWAVHQAGGSIPDGSQNQRGATQRISVQEAARTPGALLFNGHHVAISVGDGVHTIEAMGSAYGVRIGTIGNRFEDGGLVKGLKY